MPVAHPAPPLDVPLRADKRFLAQRRGGFFAKLTTRRLKRRVFQSLPELQAAINRFLAETNDDPKPFVWTAEPEKVLAAVKRGKQALEAIH